MVRLYAQHPSALNEQGCASAIHGSITPPELASDIIKSGIVLCGGGAYLYGLKEALTAATGLNVKLSQNPLECVALGAMELLDSMRRGAAQSAVVNY